MDTLEEILGQPGASDFDGARLAFSVTPTRPPTFSCCLSPGGDLHVAVAEGAELRWSVVAASGSGAPPAPTVLHGHQDHVTALAFLCHPALRRTFLVSASVADVLLYQGPPFDGDDGSSAADSCTSYRCVGLLSPSAEGLDSIGHVTLCVHGDDIWFAASAGHECVVGAVPSGLLAGTGGNPRIVCRMKGHEAPVTTVAFVPASGDAPLLLVSASEDRTLKMWDVQATAFVYSTPIVSAAAFTSLAVHPASRRVAAGSADGRLRLYSVSERNGPSWCLECLTTISLAPKHIALRSLNHQRAIDATPEESIPVICSKPRWKQPVPLSIVLTGCSENGFELSGDSEDGEASFSVSAVVFAAVEPATAGGARLAATDTAHLLVATATTVLHVNTRNHSVSTLLPFARGSSGDGEGLGVARSVVCCASAEIPIDGDEAQARAARQREQRVQCMQPEPEPEPEHYLQRPLQVACGVSAAFEPLLAVFALPISSATAATARPHRLLFPALAAVGAGANDEVEFDACATVDELASLSFPEDSVMSDALLDGPIGRGLRLTAQCSGVDVVRGGAKATQRGRGGKLVDKPTTFHTRIASSGYGRDKVTHSRGRGRSSGRRGASRTAAAGDGAGRRRELSDVNREDWKAPTVPQPQHTIPALHNGPIHHCEFSTDGSRLASCSSDQTAHCLRLPVAKHNGDGVTCIGHTARVSSVSFSSRGDQLITAGDDRTARVWVVGRTEPVLTIDRIERNLPTVQQISSPSASNTSGTGVSFASTAGGRAAGANSTFGSAIVAAQFFHGDRLLLVAGGQSIGLYGYSIDTSRGKRDDKPHLSQGRYRRAHTYAMDGTPVVTALAAVNGVGLATGRLLAAGSNKVLELIDVNDGMAAREGGRAVLAIPNAHDRAIHCIALASTAANGDDSLFLTSATDGALKLWDVRDPSMCVQVWSAHTNRVHPIGAALSACGRFAACGSEDKLVYVYDLRRSDGAGGKEALWKLRGHTDAVLDVAFNPMHPQLATVGADAKVLFFCDG